MSQKIIKIGTSLGITLPKSLLEYLGVSVGERIETKRDEKTGRVYLEPVTKKGDAYVPDTENIEWTKKFIEQYRPALEELSDK